MATLDLDDFPDLLITGPNNGGLAVIHRGRTVVLDRLSSTGLWVEGDAIYRGIQVEGSRATPGFLHYYFQTAEGFAQILDASPGSIARNKTLSAQQLPSLAVPLPSMDAQHWFDALQQSAAKIRHAQDANGRDLGQIIPAMLGRMFNGA